MPYKKGTLTGKVLRIGAGTVAAALMKRRPAGSRTVQKRKIKPKAPQATGNEYKKYAYKQGGAPKLTLKRLAREVRLGESRMILVHRDYTTWGSVSGAYILACAQTALGSPLVCINLLMFDLTGVMNANSAGAINYPVSFSHPTFSNETNTATVSWTNGPLQTMEKLDSVTGIDTAVPNRTANHQWTSIKAMLYSAGTIVTKVEFSIVQFLDDDIIPGETNAKAIAFWQSILHPAVKNPICTNTPLWTRKAIKLISRKTFVLDPKETTENVQANLTEVNMFVRHGGRTIHYDEANTDRVNMLQDDDTFVNVGGNSTNPKPKYRRYLMIRAYTRRNGIADVTLHPSMDLIVRNCFTFNN